MEAFDLAQRFRQESSISLETLDTILILYTERFSVMCVASTVIYVKLTRNFNRLMSCFKIEITSNT